MLKLDPDFVPASTSARSGNESVVERWILHKLNHATAEVERQLEDRNFMNATGALWNFWLYEFCDVFIEASKPMTDESASAETRQSTQQTLYTCLDSGLRLLHPFMPYVTEELWQRLPRRSSETAQSISMAAFPEASDAAADAEAEAAFDLVFLSTKASRSLAVQYGIQSGLQSAYPSLARPADNNANLFLSRLGRQSLFTPTTTRRSPCSSGRSPSFRR
jgi:valyl-tRNA synthetase